MIALCATHHGQAHAWTVGQVRAMKAAAASNLRDGVQGRFQWMRNSFFGAVGGTFYYECRKLVVVRGEPIVWFNRNDQGLLMLNVSMLTVSREPRVQIVDNDWISKGSPIDLQSPPSGDKLIAKYSNGDYLAIKFRNLSNTEDMHRAHPQFQGDPAIEFPIVSVSVVMRAGGTPFDFSATETRLPGHNIFRGGYVSHGEVGFSIG